MKGKQTAGAGEPGRRGPVALLMLFARRHGYAFALGGVIAATALFVGFRALFAKEQWALVYLMLVGLTAGLTGVGPALLAAGVSFCLWNFFYLPPFYSFAVHDSHDWLSLIVFLIAAVAIGTQTGRLREREAEASARGREAAMLNHFSARLVSDVSVEDVAALLADEVRELTGATSAALFVDQLGGLARAGGSAEGEEVGADVPELAAWTMANAKALGLPQAERRSGGPAPGWPICVSHEQAGAAADRTDMFIPLQTASRLEGVLYVGARPDGSRYTSEDARPLVAVANQTAALLERKRLEADGVQARALREADRLKSTLVSSVSHELKTPIASLTATISNLAEQDVEWDAEKVRPELASIQDDVQRLSSSIDALLDLSRLEASAWEPRLELFELADVVRGALERVPARSRGRVRVEIPSNLPMVLVDHTQTSRALENLLTNALAYSGSASEVRVGASAGEGRTLVWVEDDGPGVAPDEREKVFEKFYRGEAASTSPAGTGLGLAVTREIVRAQGGSIWVEDGEGGGARFVISLKYEES